MKPQGEEEAAGRCDFCGDVINPDRDYRRVVGWEKCRGQKSTLKGRELQGSWACAFCVDKVAAGIAPMQGSLM